MKRLFKFSIVILLLLNLLLSTAWPVTAQNSGAINDNSTLVATITGLEKGDQAKLILYPEGVTQIDTAILEKEVQSNGDSTITVEVPISVKDGYYQLMLEAPDIYFRTPKGYLFQVLDSQVVNPRSRLITFDLIPPTGRQYEPYRGTLTPTYTKNEPVTPTLPKPGDVIYRAEYMISLSAPPKQSIPILPNTLDAYKYFAGYLAAVSNIQGVWGTLGVVDTGVTHDYSHDEFIADQVYANSSGGWMEIGWAEVDWQGDYQYLYEFDSSYNDWRIYFQVSSGTSIHVAVQRDSGTTWISQWYNGSYWVQMSYEDIGISTAVNAHNAGEICTSGSPSFPSATTSWSALRIGDNWDRWDTDYTYATYTMSGGGYDSHYTYQFYNFYVHKH